MNKIIARGFGLGDGELIITRGYASYIDITYGGASTLLPIPLTDLQQYKISLGVEGKEVLTRKINIHLLRKEFIVSSINIPLFANKEDSYEFKIPIINNQYDNFELKIPINKIEEINKDIVCSISVQNNEDYDISMKVFNPYLEFLEEDF